MAACIKSTILDLMGDLKKLAFYNINLTANAHYTIFMAAHLYPMWSGIVLPEVQTNETTASCLQGSIMC